MTSRRLVAVATTYDVTSTRCSRDDLWRRRFWHSSIFRIRFWCDDVSGVRNGRRHLRFWVILVRPWWSRAAVFHCDILNPAQGLNIYISGEYMEPHYYCLTSPHGRGSGAGVIITPSYVKSFQILGDVLTRSS